MLKLFILLMLNLVFSLHANALTLEGSTNHEYGRIGIKILNKSRIVHIYTHSPAAHSDLQKGDKILEADGFKGTDAVDGLAGTTVKLKIKRGKETFTIEIMRVPKDEIYDELNMNVKILEC